MSSTGAIITANANGLGMFLFGRWLTGFGCTAANTAAKSYIAEITAPAVSRCGEKLILF